MDELLLKMIVSVIFYFLKISMENKKQLLGSSPALTWNS